MINKGKIILTGIISIFVLFFILRVGGSYHRWYNIYTRWFDENKEEFIKLKEYILLVCESYGEAEVFLPIDGNMRIGKDIKHVPEEIMNLIKILTSDAHGFTYISVSISEERVKFGFEGNPRAILFMFDTKKPSYMNSADDNISIKIIDLYNGWYYIESN